MTENYELNLKMQSDVVSPELMINLSKIFALIVAISYGGGLWVNIQHELEGAHEVNELSPVLHWLRDSTLAMFFIFFGVLMALAFSRWLIQRMNKPMPRFPQLVLITICLGVFSGAAFAIGIPVHGYIFGVHLAEGVDLISDMLKDGSLVALINMGVCALMIFAMNGLE
jgi:hypothetical protein